MIWLPLLPLLTSFFILMITCLTWHQKKLQKIFHVIGAIILLFVVSIIFYVVLHHGILVVQIGSYPAPFGITIVIDLFSAIMLLITGIISFSVSLYALEEINNREQALGFYAAYWALLMGICGAFSTGDLFNLYVWFEVMLISSFVLLVLGNHKVQLGGTLKYVGLHLVATLLMLLAIALLYGMVGTLNMADLSIKLETYSATGIATTVVLLLTIAFSIKAALFPLFFWLPEAYHTTNVTTSAIFAGMLTKVGVYALIRLTTLILPGNHIILTLLLISSGFTMLTGVFGAVSQYYFRRLLSFHIISQIGYMVVGLAIYTPFALAGAIYFIIHNILAKTNLFFISGICARLEKTSDIRKLGGFYHQFPVLSFLFFISAFSLAGLPPLSGFWGKLILLKSALITHHYITAAVLLFVSLLTLYSMTKIWNQVFWKEKPASEKFIVNRFNAYQQIIYFFPVIILAIITFVIGIFPQTFLGIALQASNQLFDRSEYIQAVLGYKYQ